MPEDLRAAILELIKESESIADQLERVGDSRKDGPFVDGTRDAIAQVKRILIQMEVF